MENLQTYADKFSELNFWDKIKTAFAKAGKEVVNKTLVLYYSLMDKDTPAWAKTVIIGALGYFISPIDLTPDFLPAIGYTDDLTVLISAFGTVASSVKEEHKTKAGEILNKYFGQKDEPLIDLEEKSEN